MPTNNAIDTPKPIDVPNGGTGLSTTTTAYGVIAAGTTATAPLQNIGTGSSGQILVSNGAGVLPSFQTPASMTAINFVSITASGTYTPPSNLLYAIVECVGGGGGSSGIDATGVGQVGVSAAGGGGGYSKKIYAKSALLPNVSVTIGAAGAAGAAGATNGGNGGTTTFLGMSAPGGDGGTNIAVGATAVCFGTNGGVATGGDINITGSSPGVYGYSNTVGGNFNMGYSGTSPYSSQVDQNAGNGYGGGGSSNWSDGSVAAKAGFAGSPGVVFITEFLA